MGVEAALVDFEPDEGVADAEERAADAYALELLTGAPQPDVVAGAARFSARELARAAVETGRERGIEPGTLALVLAHQKGAWPTAMKALPS